MSLMDVSANDSIFWFVTEEFHWEHIWCFLYSHFFMDIEVDSMSWLLFVSSGVIEKGVQVPSQHANIISLVTWQRVRQLECIVNLCLDYFFGGGDTG